MSKTYFDNVDDAMEEAAWLADVYRSAHVISWERDMYSVFAQNELIKEVVLEVFNPLAPAVRCRNCGYIDERGADTSIIQGA